MSGGGVCYCTLPPGQTSSSAKHRGVEEIWYVLEGEGEIWRKRGSQAETVRMSPGTCLTIPPGTAFQFRNVGADPLRILITTMPPWPGPDEAVATDGLWPATTASPGS
jgi:mannose-6-phosphate isomerase-like protein (cupin superfamily)